MHNVFGTEEASFEGGILFGDPGLGGTGLAFWDELDRPTEGRPMMPNAVAALTAPQGKAWLCRARTIADKFERIVNELDPGLVVLEWQELWTGSAESMASASAGNLFKLTILTGMLTRIAHDWDAEVVLATPSDWKGQLSKKAIDNRIKRALGKKYHNHISDAVGMGLTVQGVL